MNLLLKAPLSRERGAALIIVLAIVVLLTGLSVAYLTRSTSDRQVAQSSFNQSSVDQLAQSAMDNIIGSLRQEIVDGSASPAPAIYANGLISNLYVPCANVGCNTPAPSPGSTACPNGTPTILPILPIYYPSPSPGTTPALSNLIRRSVASDTIPCPATASRASAVNSTVDRSANNRSVALKRWNSHYLLPKYDTGSDDPTPPSPLPSPFNPNPPVANGFTPPDWVFVNDQGPTVINSPDASIIGRYAYAIYDESGLLDMNAVGYPSPTTMLQYGRKGSLAFTDLSGLPGLSPTPGSTPPIDKIVGWRNYASAQPGGTFPNFSFSANSTNTYYNFILSDPTNIQLTNYFTGSPLAYFTNSFLTTSQAPVFNTQTEQALAGRQILIKLRSGITQSGIGFVNALQFLGTFSREALSNIPQWSPATPDSINPNFQTLLAGPQPTPNPSPITAAFTRNDGITTAYVGESFVNRRFLLQRLNWLTYRGPSANRTIPSSAPSLGDPNYDMWLLTRSNGITFGLTSAFLQQGTAGNILKYFGLVWDTTNERWNYTSPSGGSLATFIATLDTLTTTREPDFFELLQAGIINSSLGDSFSPDTALPLTHQQSRMLHILTIGANLIAQSRVDSYPVRIACNVGGTTMEAVGAPRLPYLNSLAVCPVAGTATSGLATGGVNWLLVPNLWDPFRDTWDLTEEHAHKDDSNPTHANNIWLTPGYLRPPVRITVSGTVGLGTVLAPSPSPTVSPSVVTGIVSSALVTPSPSPVAIVAISPAQSIILTTPTASPGMGRNGFLEASRISSADVTPVPAAFTTTTSVSPTPTAAWNTVAYPAPTANPTPVGTNVVFRISFPGSSIPDTWTSPLQHPVLILRPGFQITVDYQSPTDPTKWYSYSFLQGNNEPSTWISGSNPSNPGLNLTTTWSVYGRNPSPAPTPTTTPFPTILLAASSPAPATVWDIPTLAEAPMFAKADPRSMRYNSQIGVVRLTSPTPTATPLGAGIIRSIWPSGYTTPPPMTIGLTPIPSPTPTPSGTPSPTPIPPFNGPNPATLGDNTAAGPPGNPYSEPPTASATPNPWRPVMMNRPFRSVGEMAYAFRDQPFRTLSFSSANSPDAGLLDLFTTNDYTDSSGTRGGVINLNSGQVPALAAVLRSTITREDTPRVNTGGGSPSPAPMSSPVPTNVAASLLLAGPYASPNRSPVLNRAGLANLIAGETGLGPSVPKTQRESIARALGQVDQTRTWNLLIDVIAQTGKYPPGATSLANGFVVEGEQHYWVHVAIDRFTGYVIDKQIEVVNE